MRYEINDHNEFCMVEIFDEHLSSVFYASFKDVAPEQRKDLAEKIMYSLQQYGNYRARMAVKEKLKEIRNVLEMR